MPVVALDGEYVAVFKFNDQIEIETFASRRALFERFSAVRAELARRPDSNDSPRLEALVATLTDEFIGREPQDYGAAADLLSRTLYGEPHDKDGIYPPGFDKKPEPEPDPLHPGTFEPWKPLDDDFTNAAATVIAGLKAGGKIAVKLRQIFADADQPFAAPPAETILPAATVLGTDPVPEAAPTLWADRPKKHGTSPADFINEYYSFCMANLGQHHLRKLDNRLYCRYNDWKNEPGRRDDELVPFGVSYVLDEATRGRRVREGSRRSKAKSRTLIQPGSDTMPRLDR